MTRRGRNFGNACAYKLGGSWLPSTRPILRKIVPSVDTVLENPLGNDAMPVLAVVSIWIETKTPRETS